MAPSPRFPSTSDQPRNEWTENVGSRRFPSSRLLEVEYWTETRDLKVIAEAARNGGVVTTSTLRTSGFSEPATRAAVRRGLLTRWGRGVYLVGPLANHLTEARAAMFAVADGTLGFAAAAQLAEIGPLATPPVDVIVSPQV